MTTKDWLEILVVPVTLALLALVWPLIQSWSRKRAFMSLIQRELRELGPYPELAVKNDWADHLQKTFVHQRIFQDASTNRDLLLSLAPNVTYYLSQLWNAHAMRDYAQWHHCLKKLLPFDKTTSLATILAKWEQLQVGYEAKS
ncbi:hypothetical protein [Janthinobacterium fluminis]|uniref:DUF4381 domain-containing protein n=1 Tax=Janthinobacterium fluminis TaxID=2987524 RepID=A0ABT5K626_9BURK|nr:hypothetical protein [Janthinobacterium fluminis]MDC8759536.1 hypothetical protein [Janthinobacterium fluminis]